MGLQMGEKNDYPEDEARKAMRLQSRSVEAWKEKSPRTEVLRLSQTWVDDGARTHDLRNHNPAL
jgi:hypothetical protein